MKKNWAQVLQSLECLRPVVPLCAEGALGAIASSRGTAASLKLLREIQQYSTSVKHHVGLR